jgi:hypothetical protein
MNAKALTESGWKAVVSKFKVKDNGLQKALAAYEKLDDQNFEQRAKAVALICQFATALSKVKDLADDAVDYIDGILEAGEAEKAGLSKEQAAATKAAAEAKKKEDAAAKEGDEEDEDEEEEGDYKVKLLAAFQKLKGAKDVAFQFIVCDAKPHCGLMLAKKISTKHRQLLTDLTGSKRFLHLGTCQFESGKFVFTMEKPVSGLARKLQDSVKNFTGKKLPIKVGTETAEAEEDQPAAASSAEQTAAARPVPPALAKAPEAWHQARNGIEASIKQLKTAIRNEFAKEAPELIADIEKNMSKLDGILDKLDRRLADSLDKARAAKDAAARSAELRNSKSLLADYIKYVKAEPMIAHIDSNPFGVKTNLKQTLTTSLTQMAQAIG